MSEAKTYTPEQIEACRMARFLLPDPGPEVVGYLLATLDEARAEVERLKARWDALNEIADTNAVTPGFWGKVAARAMEQRDEARALLRDLLLRLDTGRDMRSS